MNVPKVILTCWFMSMINSFYMAQADRSVTPGQIPGASANVQEDATRELLKRLIPEKASLFEIEISFDFEEDFFELSERNDKILIRANRGYSAAAGVYHYLKTFCGCHVAWSGKQLQLPDQLPKPAQAIKITFNDKYRYYQNVCTSSYSYVWWNWTRWEQEIDWMAINGINLALAFTAQEAIYRKVFRSLNFTENEVSLFFTGPAFLAWNRMGNVQTWGGPLSANWHVKQVKLQHRILDRMRSFGMTPVLPAFSGRVPPAFSRMFPNTTTILNKKWGHFNPPYGNVSFLDPVNPMFSEIAEKFLHYYIEEFGTNHIYNLDLFNEMPPPSTDVNYLSTCGRSVYESLVAVDPSAIWLLQGWMFYSDEDVWQPPQARALLRSVPLGKMIVLDLQSELYPQYQRLSSYYGQPFIWCMLHNYGGVTGLYGSLDQINEGTFEGRRFEGSTMIGTGLTPEGIETNDIVYELMNEMSWRKQPVDFEVWLADFAKRRYGVNSTKVATAFMYLKMSVYNASVPYRNHGKYILIRRPSLRLKPYVWYNPKDVFKAWNLFLNASEDLEIVNSQLYRHDLVDLTRQCLQLVMDVSYAKYTYAYRQKNLNLTRSIQEYILQLLDDLNEILSSDEKFLLGRWLNDAKNRADTPEEETQNEFNARNQITLWGPNGEILDYASKQWAGLIESYYKKRWQLFFNIIDDCLSNEIPFNQNNFNQRVFDEVEVPFNVAQDEYPIDKFGDSTEISRKLFDKYYFANNLFRKH